jgi:FMN-binding domain/4Fe-4S binding domain
MARFKNILIVVLIPLALVLSWAGGEYQVQSVTIERIQNISDEISEVNRVDDHLFRGRNLSSGAPIYIALENKPSYGGPLTVATVVNDQKQIEHVAILQSSDTSSYLQKVVGLGVLSVFVKQPVDALPQIDVISGATISSSAIMRGIERAANRVGVAEFGLSEITETKEKATPETAKLSTVFLLFAAAWFLTSKKFPLSRRNSRWALMVTSVITIGVMYGALLSLSTLVILISGSWTHGLASYAPLLCLVLAGAAYLLTKKNLYCSVICPFGAVQEGLGMITGCSSPVRTGWMQWLTRLWVFVLLAAALYFHAPSDAIYEPFGKAFNFIGSSAVYILTIIVVISSLIVRRPWCVLFCPASVLFDYFKLARSIFEKRDGQLSGLGGGK